MHIVRLIFKNVMRNLVRTLLTAGGTVVLVLVVTMIWTILTFLSNTTTEKAENMKAIVTERWQIPSQMPFSYAVPLSRGGASKTGDITPEDSMTWQFYGGTLDPKNRTRENIVFFFGMDPTKILSMMDELDEWTDGAPKREVQAAVDKMVKNRRGVIIGSERLKSLNKNVGDSMKVTSLNYKDIDLEVEIVGTIPPGTRYDNSAFMNREYINGALEQYKRDKGSAHPMEGRTLNLVWLRVGDRQKYEQIAGQLLGSPEFTSPSIKVETQASGISTFLEAYRDLIWGMRWLMAPAVLFTLSLVIANAISISVRERHKEIAILKVLGFQPYEIMLLVLGEAVSIGALSGLASAAGAYFVINNYFGGIKMPIAFFPAFFVPGIAILWGLGVGAGTAFLGSIVPALSAQSVKVADVFSKVN